MLDIVFLILSALGKYKSSKAGEKGTGVWGGVIIFIGAFKDEKALSDATEEKLKQAIEDFLKTF